MSLTRPKIAQFDTTATALRDPLTIINSGSTVANVDIGFIMDRNNGTLSNVALYWNESGNTFVTAFTSNSGATNTNVAVTSYANLRAGSATVDALYTGGLRWSGNNQTILMGSTYTSSSTPPTNPNPGDTWFDSATGVWYTYETTDGGNYWVDMFTPVLSPASVTSSDAAFNGNLLPSNNDTYNVGAIGNRWKTVYTNTLNAAGGTMTATASTLVLGSPSGGSFIVSGTEAGKANVAFGNIIANSGVTSTSIYDGALQVVGGVGVQGNVYASAVYTNNYRYANGSAVSTTINLAGTSGTGSVSIDGTLTFAGTYGVTASASSSTITVGTPQDLRTTANPTFAGGTYTSDLHVVGNIYVANLISVSSSITEVTSPLVYLESSYVYPYDYDIGMYSHFRGGPANVYAHTGAIRSYQNGYWGFFSNVTQEPALGAVVNWSDSGLVWDTIKAGALILANTTTSTSNSSGALRVSGGVGIAGNLYVGSNASPLLGSAMNGISLQGQLQPYTVQGSDGTITSTVLTLPSAFNITAFAGSSNVARSIISKSSFSNDLSIGAGSTGYQGNVIIQAGTGSPSGVKFVSGPYPGYTSSFDYAGNLILAQGANVAGYVTIANTTNSTSTTTGALQVAGGIGVAQSIYVGGTGAFVGGVTTSQLTSNNSTPRLYNDIQTNVSIGGTSTTVNILSTNTSTSTTTGALVIAGGTGIAGNLNVGGGVVTSNSLLVNNTNGQYKITVVQDGAGNANSNITGAGFVLGRTTGYSENLALRHTGGSNGIGGTTYAGQLIGNGVNALEIFATGSAPIVVGNSSTERFRVDGSGHLIPGADNTYNLGSSSMRWANMYTGDLHLSNETRGGNDIDGTTGNWTIQEGEDDLFIVNNKSGKKYKFTLQEVK